MPWRHSYPHSICWLQLPVFIYLNGLIKIQETKSHRPTTCQGLALNLFTKTELSKAYSSGRGGESMGPQRKWQEIFQCWPRLSMKRKKKMIYIGAHVNVRSCRIRPVLYNYWMLKEIYNINDWNIWKCKT